MVGVVEGLDRTMKDSSYIRYHSGFMSCLPGGTRRRCDGPRTDGAVKNLDIDGSLGYLSMPVTVRLFRHADLWVTAERR